MKITIWDSAGSVVVNEQAMTKDDTGQYHYDYTSAPDALLGTYKARAVATDGERITMIDLGFVLKS